MNALRIAGPKIAKKKSQKKTKEEKKMDNIQINNHNKVKARGRIVGIGRDDYGHRSLILFIRGGRDSRPVYVSFAFDADLPLNVTVQSFVNIEGYVTAYSYRNEVWGRQSYVQYFVAEKIELSKTQLEEAFPEECAGQGFAHRDAFINVALMGEIVRISRSEAQKQEGSDKTRVWTRIMLRIDPVKDGHRPSLVNVQYSSNMRVSETPIHVGDKVCMTALVSSKRKNTSNQTEDDERRSSSRRNARNFRNVRNFEDIIVNDLVVIEHAQPETDPTEVEKILLENEAETAVAQDAATTEDNESSFFAGVETE